MSVWSFGCLRLILEALCARKLEFGAGVEYNYNYRKKRVMATQAKLNEELYLVD